jgi:hypothetical protein
VAAISQQTRENVERDLRERWGDDFSIRDIAAAHGIGDASVRRIAAAAGLTAEATARAKTKSATETLKERNARNREALSADLLELSRELIAEIRTGGSVVSGISFGEVVASRIPMLNARDKQSLLVGLGIALDKHRMLDTYDQDRDTTEVGKFLRALAGEGS